MNIICNGQTWPEAPSTISALLLARWGEPCPAGIAVAVNQDILPRQEWPTHSLLEGDVVEIVTAVQGG
ncbi:MAG: sulfur carrier protein ThiS [Nocardioidaceae bacterium]|nr:sulfur carrier protein ThiS [Nocardioidaceae bacterium]